MPEGADGDRVEGRRPERREETRRRVERIAEREAEIGKGVPVDHPIYASWEAPTVEFICLCGEKFNNHDAHALHAVTEIRIASREDAVRVHNEHRVWKIQGS